MRNKTAPATMKKQKRTIGSIIKINLNDNYHSYGIILDKAAVAVFSINTKEDLTIPNIIKEKVLFIVAVYYSAITSGRWQKIGKAPIDDCFKILPLKFIQDPINPKIFQLYNPNTGVITKATKEECLGLECAAVWEAVHVERRIIDTFNGKEYIEPIIET